MAGSVFGRTALAVLAVVAPARGSGADADVVRMAEVVRARVADGSFAGAVLVARGGEVLLHQGYGLADREWEIPNTPEARFRLGSVTKQFTAAAFLLLEEEGRLSLDDRVSAHLAHDPEAWDGITLLHLLTHTSGIPSFTDLPQYPTWKLQPATAAETVGRFRDLPLEFEPGSQMRYSNSGYLLLGLLLEEITGQSYGRFLEERVFGPLGMQDTGVDSNAAVLPRRARGYSPAEDGARNAHLGALVHGESVTPPQERQAIELSAERLERLAGHYELAPTANLVVAVTEGGLTARIAGQPKLALFPESETRFFAREVDAQVEFELDESGAVTALVLHQGGAERRAPRLAAREAVALSAAALEEYAGTYELQPGFDLVIRVEGGRLLSRATGQPEVELFAEAEDRFFLKAANAQIDFERDDGGDVVALVLHQGGQDLRAPRR